MTHLECDIDSTPEGFDELAFVSVPHRRSWYKVRSKEILATLTGDGRIAGHAMHAGDAAVLRVSSFDVGAVAQRRCETAKRTYQGRRLEKNGASC